MGPLIERYRKLDPESPEAVRLRRIIAVNIPDATSLCLILGVDSSEAFSLYPGLGKPVNSTMETIDSFLDKFGGKTDSIPGVYIPEIPEPQPVDAVPDLIREHRYEEALEIIESQNLNNTEKNIYFADQIRFLKKLIKIKNHKK